MSHIIFQAKAEYTDTNGDTAYVDSPKFTDPESLKEWGEAIQEGVYDEKNVKETV